MHLLRTASFFGKTAPLLGTAALTVLGLAAVPAQAQSSLTLNSGDSLTVSGAGSIGIVGGQPVSNTKSSYTSTNTSAVVTEGAATFTLASGGALTTNSYYDPALAADGSGAVTITGGSISSNYEGLTASKGGGTVTVAGGSISGGQIGLFDDGQDTVTVTGGSISSREVGLETAPGGTVTITGGSISGGDAGLSCDGTINLFSQGDTRFLIDGVAMNNTTLFSNQYGRGYNTISGTLANGDKLNTTFIDFGKINLNIGDPPASAAPEPSSVAVWAFVGLGAAGLVLKAKKRKVAA